MAARGGLARTRLGGRSELPPAGQGGRARDPAANREEARPAVKGTGSRRGPGRAVLFRGAVGWRGTGCPEPAGTPPPAESSGNGTPSAARRGRGGGPLAAGLPSLPGSHPLMCPGQLRRPPPPCSTHLEPERGAERYPNPRGWLVREPHCSRSARRGWITQPAPHSPHLVGASQVFVAEEARERLNE